MGEYGTPNIPIKEGYLDIEHKDRRNGLLYDANDTESFKK
ncbi:UDP-sulfoquinovose synthase [Planococcus antarcticus DSM 14505]|uniref:UDP-sulfoquinovose synthase n=1 Tax=Planococcus antarcticus DSM 14505 TaxID=1185653 RepID=A0AA87ILA3_9BACL|nr:UDP-sulfoquinovose synthase [Planococcus antarcticus DSM 14505]